MQTYFGPPVVVHLLKRTRRFLSPTEKTLTKVGDGYDEAPASGRIMSARLSFCHPRRVSAGNAKAFMDLLQSDVCTLVYRRSMFVGFYFLNP